MLPTILIALGALLVVLAIVIALQPNTFRIARSVAMKARPDAIFPHINNLRLMEAWSPWEKMDPDMAREYDGPPAGTGATYHWSGNRNIGEGRMTITESRLNELVASTLEFIRPFQCTNQVEFSLSPHGDETVVTWSMTGHNKFINKAMCLVMNMDKMCGSQFEKGLNDLKALVEGTASTSTASAAETLISPELTT